MNKDQEEFEKLRKRLYALADKMGMRLEITVRRKRVETVAEAQWKANHQREPGEE
jgi:hypothetical protein